MDRYERVEVTSRKQWREWLAAHHTQKESIWLVVYKKHTGARWVPVTALVEEALCYGWIDSLGRKVDDERWMLLMSPRRANSVWSVVNKERVERLAADGLMSEAGLAKVNAAKESGMWTFLDDVTEAVIPADLADALTANPTAKRNFEDCTLSLRRSMLLGIKLAKRPETRLRRILQVVTDMSAVPADDKPLRKSRRTNQAQQVSE